MDEDRVVGMRSGMWVARTRSASERVRWGDVSKGMRRQERVTQGVYYALKEFEKCTTLTGKLLTESGTVNVKTRQDRPGSGLEFARRAFS